MKTKLYSGVALVTPEFWSVPYTFIAAIKVKSNILMFKIHTRIF